MNPSSSGYWNNPPPPGTEFDDFEEASNSSSKKDGGSTRSSERPIDRIDPYVKNPLYVGKEREYSSDRSRYRSRSKSHEHHKRRRSRDRHRRSRSHSRRRKRRYTSSRSRSRSRSPSYSRHRRSRHKQKRSRSISRSRSRSNSRSKSYRSHRERKSRSPVRRHKSPSEERQNIDGDVIKEEDMRIEEDDEEPEQSQIPFKNDGSFLEMFKRMQEQQKAAQEAPAEGSEVKKPGLPVFGKRRGGKVLKTGLVQKVKTNEDDSGNAQDAWSIYMKEVRRYKEACCDDDSKTRPLVK